MPRRIVRSAARALLLAVVGPGLAACGGSQTNGVETKPPDAILAASKQAADAATSVHVAGSGESTGAPTTYDLSLVKGKGARGTVSVNGLSFALIRVGSTIYVKGSPAFYRRFSGAAAERLRGRWVKGESTTGRFAAIGPYTDLSTVVDQALTRQPHTLTKGASTTVARQKVVQVSDSTGTLSVATTGKPYPVEIATKGGASAGTLTFDRWNADVPLTAPADSIDINQLPAGR